MTRATSNLGGVAAGVALALSGCSQPADQSNASLFAAAPTAQWRLPNRLSEISGLALSPDGRLFAHDDERAVIYQIDMTNGDVATSFALGEPAERGDFEGLAITPAGEFWLTTSQGRLYRFREGDDGDHVAFDRLESGLGDICEVEGLAYLAPEESLILACKTNHARDMRNALALYTWPIAGGPATLWRAIPGDDVAAAAGVRALRPSSVEIDSTTGRILLLSARDGALAEFDARGALVAARQLGPAHAQAEGLTVTADGTLVIADEGAGGRALISLYGRTHD